VTRNSGIDVARLISVFSTEAEAASALRGERSARRETQDPISGAIETLEAMRRSEARRQAAFSTSADA
jgi:hypothetical protein